MTNEPHITNIDDSKLVQLISRAKYRIFYMAPGITDPVAAALSVAWMRLGDLAVHVILDVDPEVCRMGYGTLEGLKTVVDYATRLDTQVYQQPGVRIGVLIVDETTIIYTPTPLLIEAGSTQPDHPNAIQLNAPPQEIVNDIGSLGRNEINYKDLKKTEKDLSECPPVKFDLARKVRVYTTRFQFVEFEMTGCYISRKKVRIPNRLMSIFKDPDLQDGFHAHFDLISSKKLEVTIEGTTYTEESLRKQKEKISKKYLIPLKGYGNIVLRSNKEDFLKEVGDLEESIAKFKQGIEQDLQKFLDKNVELLVNELLPAVIQNPPTNYTKYHGQNITKEKMKILLHNDLRNIFGRADELIKDMSVNIYFKDVTLESLKDEKFLEIAHKAMPHVDAFHEEYEAVKADKIDKKN
ncbi:MAG TPA: hypothetical protein PK360_01985 [bacterium]|nr:hypothetical protein [bacterium]